MNRELNLDKLQTKFVILLNFLEQMHIIFAYIIFIAGKIPFTIWIDQYVKQILIQINSFLFAPRMYMLNNTLYWIALVIIVVLLLAQFLTLGILLQNKF